MKNSRLLVLGAVLSWPMLLGAQCGGETVQQCQDSEGRIVACPSDDAGSVQITHDAGPRPDAGSADTGRNLPFEASCTPGETGGCRFACLATPDGWPGEGSGGFCTKPCANHAECGDENHWRCAEVDAEYLCVRDHDRTPPTASFVGANAGRTLIGSGALALEIQAQDDRALTQAIVSANGEPTVVTPGEVVVGESGVSRRYDVSVPAAAISGDQVTISARVSDGIGQSVTLEKEFSVDTVGPSVTLVRDQNLRPGGCVPSPSSVAVDASDNMGLIHVRILVGSTVVATILPDGDNRSIDTGTMVDYRGAGIRTGQHTLKAVAEDSAGNTAEDSFRLRIATDRSSGNPCD